jgi:hypothetical protein
MTRKTFERATQLSPRILAALALATLVGCFHQPKIDGDKLLCMNDDGCLAGYVCTKRPDDTVQAFGHCVRPGTSTIDGSSPDTAGADTSSREASSDVAGQPGIDGTPAIDGVPSSMDGSLALDASSDKPAPFDLAADAPPAPARPGENGVALCPPAPF